MRPKSNFYASENLRRLYHERAGDLTQAEFAKRYGIGGQSMLAQILSGAKPLPIEAAPKLARALRCTIYEICPEMAEYIKEELLPALGKSLRRAAAILLAVGLALGLPQPAEASPAFNINAVFLHIGRYLRRRITAFYRCLLPHVEMRVAP